MLNGEWHERGRMVLVVGVAQQGVAAEATKRVSHYSLNAVRGPAERRRWAPCPPSLTSGAALVRQLVGRACNRPSSALRSQRPSPSTTASAHQRPAANRLHEASSCVEASGCRAYVGAANGSLASAAISRSSGRRAGGRGRGRASSAREQVGGQRRQVRRDAEGSKGSRKPGSRAHGVPAWR